MRKPQKFLWGMLDFLQKLWLGEIETSPKPRKLFHSVNIFRSRKIGQGLIFPIMDH